MYAFSAALALHKIKVDLPPPPKNRLIMQLPGDPELGEAHAFHYTQVRWETCETACAAGVAHAAAHPFR